jgi:hypothetical protein
MPVIATSSCSYLIACDLTLRAGGARGARDLVRLVRLAGFVHSKFGAFPQMIYIAHENILALLNSKLMYLAPNSDNNIYINYI